MAFFECTIGGSSGGAIITVTYDSTFYNKTMTCSNGVDTYTQTTTSSGVTEFEVDTEGTWTITCDGVVQTVDVTLSYSVAMVITKNITIYSAANDTLAFTDAVGSKTVTTDTNGEGVASVTFIPPSQNITFTSSVAKDTAVNSSDPYSKTITISDATTTVYVMPDKTIYWYGYKNATIESTNYGVASTNKAYPSLSSNTNSLSMGVGVNQEGSVRFSNINGITSGKLCVRTDTGHSNNAAQWRLYVSNSTTNINDYQAGGYGASRGMIEFRQAGVTTRNPYVLWIWMYLTQGLSPLYAIWLED